MNNCQQKKDYVIKIFGDIDTSKTAAIDRLPERFLKDGANVLQSFTKCLTLTLVFI